MSETWISKGLCRLCHLTEGHFRSLEACYPTPEGKEEIYSALLRETFDIVLTPPTNPSTFSICGACEERLRDAALFKKQVLDCEERFNSVYLQDGCFKHEVKEEANNHTEGFFEQPLNILQEEEKYNASTFLEIVVPQSIPKSPSVHQNSVGADERTLQCRDEYQSKEKAKKLSCNFCKKQFKNISLLLIHLKTHPGEMSCLICTESFYTNTDLIKHYGLEHGDGTNYPCTMCTNVFDKPTLLINHVKTHFGDEFKCTECEVEFVRKKDLKEHMTIHSDLKIKNLSCNVCKKRYINVGNLEKHMKRHMDKNPYNCLLCTEKFETNTDLINHYGLLHGDGTNYPCTICSKILNEPILLKNHVNVHFAKKFKCSKCEKEFKSKSSLKEHLEVHAGVKKYPCVICQKVFLHKSTLKSHMNTHTGEKSSICDMCGKRFLQKSDLKRHIIIVHDNVKAFTCDICNKNFSAKSYLRIHQRQHTGEKPYSCEVCKKNFTAYTTLSVHMRLHSGSKPYACNYCERSFAHVASYKVHVRTHTGDKPYSCEVCHKDFSDNRNLKIHMRVHSGEKPFACEICKRGFKEKSSYNRHMRIHSGNKAYTCKICNKQIADLSKHMRVHNKNLQQRLLHLE